MVTQGDHLAASSALWAALVVDPVAGFAQDAAGLYHIPWHSRALTLLLGWQFIAFDTQSTPFLSLLLLLVLQSSCQSAVQSGQA